MFKVEIEFGSLEVEDLFEPTTNSLLCIRSHASLLKVFEDFIFDIINFTCLLYTKNSFYFCDTFTTTL